MAETPEQKKARLEYYLARRKTGAYLNKPLFFYSGDPTIPPSFTGDQIAIGNGSGPGAKILNGVGPASTSLPCDLPVIEQLTILAPGPDPFTLSVLYNVNQGDVYFLFNTSTAQVIQPSSVTSVPGGVELVFDMTSPPATIGAWSFKVQRAGSPACATIRSNVYSIAAPPCLLEATFWTGPGGFPFPPAVASGGIVSTELVGSGFTTCTIDILIEFSFGLGFPPPTLPILNLVVVNDNQLTFDVDATTVPGFGTYTYTATVVCLNNPGCEDVADTALTFGGGA